MSNLDTGDADRDLTKHDRLVNAWLAVGHDATVDTVASLTGASESYASQVRQAMENGALSDDEVDEATVPGLVERYRRADASADDESVGGTAGDDRSAPPDRPQGPSRSPSQSAPPRQPHAGDGYPPPQPPQDRAPRPAESSPKNEDGLYVPVEVLREIDATLATLENEARYRVENVPSQRPQHQSALAKLYVAQRARAMVGDAADGAVPADEV